MRTHIRSVVLALLSATLACQDGGPDRAPDVFGTIANVHMTNGRLTSMLVDRLQTPAGITEIRLNVDPKARVV